MGWAAVAGIAAGALAGGQGDKGRSGGNTMSQVFLGNESEIEKQTRLGNLSTYNDLRSLLQQGPGADDVLAGRNANRSLADLLQSQQASGGLPTQAQTVQAQNYAAQIFDPQRVAMQQAFGDQDIAQQRLAARLGRGGADPILRAKLAQEQTRQQQLLQSQQGAFGAEQAMMAPQRQLQLAEALANVRGGLANQALQNRQTLLGLGQSLQESERNWRYTIAPKMGQSSNYTSSGGGIAGMIGGGLAGYGAIMDYQGKMNNNSSNNRSNGQMMRADNYDYFARS